MEKKFEELAPKYFMEGFSCSESIAKTAVDMGLIKEEFVSIATSFSGGMSSGCLCGAIAGAQMVIGLLYGKYQGNIAKKLAKEFYDEFIKTHKAACCRVLTRDFQDFHSPERRNHCVNMVFDSSKILDKIIEKYHIKDAGNKIL